MADKLLGSFVWCELLTSDTGAAESFYKKVVGWTATPFGPDGSYTVFNNSLNSGVGGAMKIPDGAKQPPCWLMYVGTPNVDETAMRIAQLGGRVLKQPDDIPTVGRFAVVQDPYGATFAIFTPKPAPGSPEPKRGGPGDFSWFELYTPNPDGAWRFYETLFGWQKTSAMDMGEMGVYQMFGRGGGIPNGGIMKPPPGASPAWMPYAMVRDAKSAAATAAANGGTIINGPMEVPGGDWIAQGIDPQGAMFAVHSLNPATARQAAPVKETVKKVLKAAAGVAATVIGGTALRKAAKKLKAKSTQKAKPSKKKPVKKKPTAKKAKKAAPKKSAKKSAKKAAKTTGKKKAAKRKR